MRVDPPRILTAVLAATFVVGGCGETRGGSTSSRDGSSDPWVAIETEFLERCAEQDDHTEADGDDVADYCRCVYVETVEFYGTPEAMAAAPVRPSGGVTTDSLLEPAFAGCADLHLN